MHKAAVWGALGAMLLALAGCGSKSSGPCSGECTAAQYCDVVSDVCVARVTEFAVAPDAGDQRNPHAIIVGPDGNLWFAETQPSALGRMTLDGTITEFATPTPNAFPVSLTVGPDGNIWFLEGIGAVGITTPAGAMTEYPFGTANNGHIAAGPDGALYFTVDLGDEIGRITPDGTMTLTSVAGKPTLIAPGPDGNLWVDVNGALTLLTAVPMPTPGFPVQNSSDTKTGFVTGADGDLYFVENDPVYLGDLASVTRFDPTTNTEASVTAPTLNAGSDGITPTPDGNIWFTEPNAVQIGRLDSNGHIDEFPVPSAPAGITTGPDGNLWFTQPTAGKIARFTPG